jgi:hypothetical protein
MFTGWLHDRADFDFAPFRFCALQGSAYLVRELFLVVWAAQAHPSEYSAREFLRLSARPPTG